MKQAFSKAKSAIAYLLCKLALYILRKRVKLCSHYEWCTDHSNHKCCLIEEDICMDCNTSTKSNCYNEGGSL